MSDCNQFLRHHLESLHSNRGTARDVGCGSAIHVFPPDAWMDAVLFPAHPRFLPTLVERVRQMPQFGVSIAEVERGVLGHGLQPDMVSEFVKLTSL